jgi:alkylhydroperoxidase family enzyme
MRIEPLEEQDAAPSVRKLFADSVRRFGKVMRPMMAYGYCPRILRAFTSLNAVLGSSRKVELKLKALVSLRAAQMIGCPF